jgi:uncharacterized coiled-coil DUF342 family protein
MIEEIGSKMAIMQRERDKYEDMIEEELSENKAKRIECVNLNMHITQLETNLMALEAKAREEAILAQTLGKELADKAADVDSKKVKEMRSIVFQFRCEQEDIEAQVQTTRDKLARADRDLEQAAKKTAQLNVEMGELKLLLEKIAGIGRQAGSGAA